MAAIATGADDDDGIQHLFDQLYAELKELAARHMRRQPNGHSLQPTALLHEAFLKLAEVDGANIKSDAHFMAVASRAMSQVLIDHARKKQRRKRDGGGERRALDQLMVAFEEHAIDLVGLGQRLEELDQLDPPMAQFVALRFFGGMDFAACSEALGIPKRTLERRWPALRAWLRLGLE